MRHLRKIIYPQYSVPKDVILRLNIIVNIVMDKKCM